MNVATVVPNDNPSEREDRYGRVCINHRRRWVVLVNGETVGEYHTKREAVAVAQTINGKIALPSARPKDIVQV